jgi:hypothetical protein
MNTEAGGMSSRHTNTDEFIAARSEAFQQLIARGVIVEAHGAHFLIRRRRGGVERVPIRLHRTKRLILLPQGDSISPLSLVSRND